MLQVLYPKSRKESNGLSRSGDRSLNRIHTDKALMVLLDHGRHAGKTYEYTSIMKRRPAAFHTGGRNLAVWMCADADLCWQRGR